MKSAIALFAGVFLGVGSITQAPTENLYKVLVIPGHDSSAEGARYADRKESEFNVILAQKIKDKLSKNPQIDVVLARNQSGYNGIFIDYFKKEGQKITAFYNSYARLHKKRIETGKFEKKVAVAHNKAAKSLVNKLYGFTKWANENKVDLMLHVHFNDHPGRGKNKKGKYEGFAIYVSDKQFHNGKSSIELGKLLKDILEKSYKVSSHPKEKRGVIEDQNLIAVGQFNTASSTAILVEYGYIYEDRFSADRRNIVFDDLAQKTAEAIEKFIGKKD